MSIANLKKSEVSVAKLVVEKVEGANPLLTPILVEGGMDFNLTGGIEGLTAIEADALNSRTLKVADLSGADMIMSGAITGVSGGSLSFGSGVPAMATVAGSVFIRTDGASGAEVVYVNHDGGAGSWSALS